MTAPQTRVPVQSVRRLRPTGAGRTHVGRIRDENEDAILVDPTGALWAVADGMGGYGHGGRAADIVTECLSEIQMLGPARVMLGEALGRANARILEEAQAGQWGHAGATVVAILIDGAEFAVAWAGDSRVYRLRDGRLEQLTHDHSVVQELVDAGSLTPQQAEAHPQAHVVTRAVGAEPDIAVAFREGRLADGDVILLCSDGLTKVVSDAEIAGILARTLDPQEACEALIAATLAAGAPDNVSVITVFVGEE